MDNLEIDYNFKNYITECKDSFPSKYNDFILDNYILLDNGLSSHSCAVIKIIDIMSNVQVAIIIFSYHSGVNTLRISNIEVHSEYKGQYIGSFLILLALQFVYDYSILINMSSMQIAVDLDDDSKRSRQPNNIYVNCGFHYYDMEDFPEMGSSLSHATRICENYFKSTITKTNKSTIFNKNISYFQPKKEEGEEGEAGEEGSMHFGGKRKNKNSDVLTKRKIGGWEVERERREGKERKEIKERKERSGRSEKCEKRNNLKYDLIREWNMNIINLKFFSVLKFINSMEFIDDKVLFNIKNKKFDKQRHKNTMNELIDVKKDLGIAKTENKSLLQQTKNTSVSVSAVAGGGKIKKKIFK